ncbi:hypothetical protein AMEX_G5987 [Astyanax mexicanus]|uniref:Uncharacterized protein n=1 Tax=Astyanax mexicanus TaxID=7994 RepID=A0A8T2M2D8_ASTMX|nr:hypothetical protein AMEX_G5987 [Astyanax mexicanus]
MESCKFTIFSCNKAQVPWTLMDPAGRSLDLQTGFYPVKCHCWRPLCAPHLTERLFFIRLGPTATACEGKLVPG